MTAPPLFTGIVTLLLICAAVSAAEPTTRPAAHEHFAVALPAAFERQEVQTDSSHPFLFRLRREDRTEIDLGFGRRVQQGAALGKLSDVELMDVIFQSSADHPKNYADFRPVEGLGWISFNKDERTSFAAAFRIEKRTSFAVAGARAAETVLYASMRPSQASYVDRGGNPAPAPMVRMKHCAFVIEAGEWKYAFKLGPDADPATVEMVREALRTFRETPPQDRGDR